MLERIYRGERFAADHFEAAYRVFKRFVAGKVPEERVARIRVDGEWHSFDEADEFFDRYVSDAERAELSLVYKTAHFRFAKTDTEIVIGVGLPESGEAEQVMASLGSPAEPRRRHSVFVGHGRNPVWRQLCQHLEAQPDIRVLTYENTIGAGVTAIELLESLTTKVDFAVLVHTRDGVKGPHDPNASENVVHETGFFQGALGRHSTLVLRQRDCPPFHNIAGLHELSFDGGAIEATFEPLLALIRARRRRT